MKVYLESSAVLAVWLGQPGGPAAAGALASAEATLTSELTCIECDRIFLRGAALRKLGPARVERLQVEAELTWRKCQILRFNAGVVARARAAFPGEPLRSLDALHLAFFLQAANHVAGLAMLSLDERVRTAASALAATVLPETV